MKKLRIIVGGFIGVMPAGGITWDYVQYPLGFALLGHDVYYIEDTRLYPIYQQPGSNWDDSSSCINHLRSVMEHFGFKERWAYRDEASGKSFGLSEEQIKEICKTADVFVNISCSTFLRDEYAAIPARVLIDSDPMFTQIQYSTQQSFTPGTPGLKQLIDAHNYHFTFGENIYKPGCQIPTCGINWIPTRQPICLEYWKPTALVNAAPSFTTLMNWTAGKVLHHNNETWGQKDIEFQKIAALPKMIPEVSLAAIVNKTGNVNSSFPRTKLEEAGWHILDAEKHAGGWDDYQQFINQSYGEFSVAKHTYVKAATGWFSCRSACYLAAGKPVITQDTGWSENLPAGKGLFAFNNMDSALDAFSRVINDYQTQCTAARKIAEDYFDSGIVLKQLLSNLS